MFYILPVVNKSENNIAEQIAIELKVIAFDHISRMNISVSYERFTLCEEVKDCFPEWLFQLEFSPTINDSPFFSVTSKIFFQSFLVFSHC